MPRFGLSTHLVHGERLSPAHLATFRAHGFDAVEVFATRTHFDYADSSAVRALRDGLAAEGIDALSMHLPITTRFSAGEWGRAFSNASTDGSVRGEAIDEARLALDAAAALGCLTGVLHLGLPRGQQIPAADNDAGAIARSLEPIAAHASAVGVKLALEVIPNGLSTPDALVGWLEGDLDLGAAGVCLDFGHAHMMGGAPEAAETLAGWIATTHVHDNRGRSDDHLVPFAGSIDWPVTLMSMFKVGYTGPWIFEVADHGDVAGVLARTVDARRRLQVILDDLASPFEFSEG
jgi:sugar phosphate isomerase/epimerase